MRRAVICAVIGVAVALALDGPAFASSGVEHLHFAAGPYLVKPGANLILTDTHGVPKPDQNGFMTRVEPNLHYARANGRCCGRIPRVDIIHLHHGVWLTDGAAGRREGNGQAGLYPFMASGEEKTVYQLPRGYGYPVGAADHWILNYMIHNLRRRPAKVYITYDMDFIPGSSPTARGITSVHPIWMDVEDHNLYPVFNVYRHSGRYGRFTFPDMANNPYKGGRRSTCSRSTTLDARRDRGSPAPRGPPRRPGTDSRGRHRHQQDAAGDPSQLGPVVPLERRLLRQARADLVGHGA